MRLYVRSYVLATLLASSLLATNAAAEVRVSMADGMVTVSARDATVHEILVEWARVGRTHIVNVDRVTGPPVSMDLVNVPEAQALDTILRSVSGYLAAARTAPVRNASIYDRIFLLPASTGLPIMKGSESAAPSSSAFVPATFETDDDQEIEEDVGRPGMRVVAPGQLQEPPRRRSGPIREGPQSSELDVGTEPTSARRITSPSGVERTVAPVGAPTPGMLVPSAQPQPEVRPEPQAVQPGQPGARVQ